MSETQPPYPHVTIQLWSEDAIVLLDWLDEVDLNSVPAQHVAVKQALTDLGSRLEKIVPYEFPLTAERVARAQHEVSRDMRW